MGGHNFFANFSHEPHFSRENGGRIHAGFTAGVQNLFNDHGHSIGPSLIPAASKGVRTMPVQPVSDISNVIAALQLLGVVPGGAKNVPACHMPEGQPAAISGRSGPEAPLPGQDRPTWMAFHRLERENRLLIDHAEMMACALGACPNCWGRIADCEDCGGIGAPGAFSPDRACFDRFILPVIARVMGEDVLSDTSEFRTAALRGRDHPQSTSV